MRNKLLERLYMVYPFKNKMINEHYYRNLRIRQLASLLHKLSWDEEEAGRSLEMIRYIEELGVNNFTLLCNLSAYRQLDGFIEFISKVTKESL